MQTIAAVKGEAMWNTSKAPLCALPASNKWSGFYHVSNVTDSEKQLIELYKVNNLFLNSIMKTKETFEAISYVN